MAGTTTITASAAEVKDPIRTYTFDWLSDGDGAASGETITVSGAILRVVFVPDSGDTQPSDQYDVTLLDASGLDVLAGQGANLSNSAASDLCPGVPLLDGTTTSVIPCVVSGTLELRVAAAGAANGGTVVVYVR